MSGILYSICIATWRPEGIKRVSEMNLPRLDGTEYVVSWQAHCDAPLPEVLAGRDDVRVVRYDGRGVSANRNNALDNARGLVALTADDDLVYFPSELEKALRQTIREERESLAVFAYEGPDAPLFPDSGALLGRRLPKGFVSPAFVIALRRSDARNGWPVMFDLRFGPGSSLGLDAAEDEMIVHTARKKGVLCRYYPIKICEHPALSTGHRAPTDGVLRAWGVYIAKEYTLTSLPRIVLKAKRVSRDYPTGFFHALGRLMSGWLKSFAIKV